MSSNSLASLNDLPVELVHYIINYLDTQTIFVLLYEVCKRLKGIVESHHQYELDFCLISKTDFYLISHRIHFENVISLTISDGNKTRGQVKYFFQIYNLNQFTQLRSLSFLGINRQILPKIFESNVVNSLHSLKLEFREHFSLANDVLTEFASLIKNSNLHKLDFNIWFCPIKTIIWPNECTLKYLKVYSCSFEGYITILRQTPALQTFIADDLDLRSRPYSNEYFHQLKSLTLRNCRVCIMNQIEQLLSFTPSLNHLKIISDTNLIDGYRWERFIQKNLSLLKKFEFFFLFYPFNELDENDIEELIKPYRTAFWIDTKQWFVTCEYIINLREVQLYSNPVSKTNYSYYVDSNKIVSSTAKTMEMNQVSKMTLNWSDIMNDSSNDRLFDKLTDLTLDIEHHCPFNSLQILSTIIDLSHLTKLTLNIQFDDDDFIPDAIENLTSLLEQTINIHSLTITYFFIDKDYDTSMELFCSMIPNHVKYLQVEFMEYDNQRIINDMKIILKQLKHLWSATFQFDPFHKIQFDDFIEWLRNEREDFTHTEYTHYLHIWLGQSI